MHVIYVSFVFQKQIPIADCTYGQVRSLTQREVQFISKVLLVPSKKYANMNCVDVYLADGRTPTHTIVQTAKTSWTTLVELLASHSSESSSSIDDKMSSSGSDIQVIRKTKNLITLRPEQAVYAPNLAESIEKNKRTGCSGVCVALLFVIIFIFGGFTTFGSLLLVPVACPVNHHWVPGALSGSCRGCVVGYTLPAASYNRLSTASECRASNADKTDDTPESNQVIVQKTNEDAAA